MRRRALISAITLSATLALSQAPPALASSGTQAVSAQTANALAMVITPVSLSALSPGSTSTGTGTITVVSTAGNWSLSAQDSSTGTPGHLVAGSSGCSGSEASLVNPLQLTVSGLLVTSAGQISLSGSNQTVASASGLGTTVLTTGFSQAVGTGESLLGGCSYGLTTTYTLQ